MSLKQSLSRLRDSLAKSDRMPVVFLGHGSPMNVIQDNPYARSWYALGRSLPRPQAILVVSAHWMSTGSTLVNVSRMPRTIHDFYGFPPELYAQQYPAPGAPDIAREVATLLSSHHAEGSHEWGLDHGAWSVLKFLYPDADVPVFQLSIDMTARLFDHVEIGLALSELRNRGVLILGSGNVVHNLRALRRDGLKHDWAEEFDTFFSEKLADRNIGALSDRDALGKLLIKAHPSTDHYLPALTVAGAADKRDELLFMTDTIAMGSISMRSFVFY